MKIRTIGLVVWLLGSSQAAFAVSFEVSDIRVEGLQRVSAGTVFNALPISAHDKVSDESLAAAGRALFKTGLFDDVRLGRDGDVLIVNVVERPSIAKIEIKGNSKISKDDLLKGLNDAGLAEGQVLQRSTLDEMQRELERVYQAQGRYSARIKTSVEKLDRNRVQVDIDINEGAVAKIKQINIVGNEAFDDDTLRGLFELEDKPGWLFGWFSNDQYSREKLTGDLERLRSYYLDRGYVNFNITSTQVSISPDKSDIFVTVNVDEGKRYKIGQVRFSGDLQMKEADARKLVTAHSGDTYSQSKLTASSEALRQTLGAEGFAFAKVDSVPDVSEEGDTVDVTFTVNPGHRAYVRRIDFKGNTTTADEVLRRELVQLEGAPASTDDIKQSQQRLQRLGFFKQVDVETRPVPNEPDQLDVVYNVQEQPSGSISASVGFAQSEGIIYGASLSQSNFLGTGNRVDIGAQKSDYYTNLKFSFTDPYWTLSGISRGYDLYYRKTDYEDSDISTYSTDAIGGGINFGYPISDLSRLNFGMGLEQLSLDAYDDTPSEIVRFIDDEGDQFSSYKLTASWTRNNLNRGIMATDGSYQRASIEASGPGSDAEYYKLRYRGQKLFELNPEWSLKFRTELGYADTYGSQETFPFYENFYSGGLGSVRGFRSNTLGQKTTKRNDGDDDTLGGNVLIEGSAELIYPFPFIEDHRQLQSTVFLDTGNTYLTDCLPVESGTSQCNSGVDLADLRYSVGLGLAWLTPVGPLTFSVAQPLNDKSGDDTQFFQFSLGQTF